MITIYLALGLVTALLCAARTPTGRTLPTVKPLPVPRIVCIGHSGPTTCPDRLTAGLDLPAPSAAVWGRPSVRSIIASVQTHGDAVAVSSAQQWASETLRRANALRYHADHAYLTGEPMVTVRRLARLADSAEYVARLAHRKLQEVTA